MALIEVFHVVADEFAVDPDFTGDTLEGMAVRLVALAGSPVVRHAIQTGNVIGLAGDTQSNTTAATQWTARLTLGAAGNSQRSTVNRVSDMFNETLASGKITVYHSGGTFKTDQYETTNFDGGGAALTYTIGEALYSSSQGLITNVNGTGTRLGTLVDTPRAYPSGVPGTETPDGSLSLGTYMTLILVV